MTMSKNRGGFTLVELLVVIAIIGTLVGLLLPAVQSAREAARRSACTNNTKQLGLACLNFESTRKRLPGCGAGSKTATTGHSWITMILPYIEEVNLYNSMSTSYGRFTATGAVTAPTNTLSQLICPSFNGTTTGGYTNYKGAAGVGATSATAPWSADGGTGGGGGVITLPFGTETAAPFTGILLAQISDGTSKTFGVAEHGPSSTTLNFWGDGAATHVTADSGSPSLAGSTWTASTLNLQGTGATSPSSVHQGRIVIHGYADGHVGSVNPEINTSLYYGIWTRSASEVATDTLP